MCMPSGLADSPHDAIIWQLTCRQNSLTANSEHACNGGHACAHQGWWDISQGPGLLIEGGCSPNVPWKSHVHERRLHKHLGQFLHDRRTSEPSLQRSPVTKAYPPYNAAHWQNKFAGYVCMLCACNRWYIDVMLRVIDRSCRLTILDS